MFASCPHHHPICAPTPLRFVIPLTAMAPSPTRDFDIDLPNDPGRRRAARSALLVAVLLHVAVIGLVLWRGPEFWAPTPVVGAPSPLRGGGGGGGGGGKQPTLVYILPPATKSPVPVPVPPVIPPPPVTPPPVPAVRANPNVVAPADSALATAGAGGPGEGPGTGGGAGGGTGGGQGPGTGTGTGPGAGGGEGGAIRPPVWSAGALPFGETPKALRGRYVDVTFWVAVDGRVERIGIEPPINDAKYREYFSEVMMRTWRFRPARAPSGEAVPGTVTIGFNLPSK